ncbi:RNA polymerase sigma factor [Enterovibrio calviensis]|uniref:RNA polymerase sigma factor n=1 Tax=Enterovibrio calviensis TaxID=91359 RepID=UPI003734ECB5
MSVDTIEIGHLLSRIALRDRKAFEALYVLTNARLFSLLKSIVKDEQIAADLLQEGFLKLWFGRPSYPINHPWAWLCQSMRNLAIDELRRARYTKEEFRAEPMNETDFLSVRPNHNPDAHSQKMQDCLLALSVEKRNVIVLAYEHGMSHQEIVKHVSTPLGTVKSWIRRGLMELKKCLN